MCGQFFREWNYFHVYVREKTDAYSNNYKTFYLPNSFGKEKKNNVHHYVKTCVDDTLFGLNVPLNAPNADRRKNKKDVWCINAKYLVFWFSGLISFCILHDGVG